MDLELNDIARFLEGTNLESWSLALPGQIEELFQSRTHGDQQRWHQAFESLPEIVCDQVDMSEGVIKLISASTLSDDQVSELKSHLQNFIPWRKGPYQLFDVYIDTEWRSDWKWDRVKPHISDLKNKLVLDVGCGSGYHSWRMAEAGAQMVLGIDPGRLFLYQYLTLKHFMQPHHLPFYMLPLTIEQMPMNVQAFDTVFSMGILYHRKSPIDHLFDLKGLLKPQGELILETLVVDGEEGYSLVPEGRYAQMRNVWFIPAISTLEQWLRRVGFGNVRTVDVNLTTTDEQRATDWMRFESLASFLDPQDHSRTIEGYPAPKRAIVVAQA